MADIVLFHSVLGVRPSVTDTAEQWRRAGHTVHVPDLYRGEVFDDYREAFAALESMGGVPELVRRTEEAVAGLPAEVVYAGFSNGGLSAEMLAATRPGARGLLLAHAAAPPQAVGASGWTAQVPVQVHYAKTDPFRDQQALDDFAAAVRGSGAAYEFHEYPVEGHLFGDAGLPDEYDAEAAESMSRRMLAFLARFDGPQP